MLESSFFSANVFKKNSSHLLKARVSLVDNIFLVEIEDETFEYQISDLNVEVPFEKSILIITTRDLMRIECLGIEKGSNTYKKLLGKKRIVAWLEEHLLISISLMIVLIGVFYYTYTKASPEIANFISEKLPKNYLDKFDELLLAHYQKEIDSVDQYIELNRQNFLKYSDIENLKIHVAHIPRFGPNAFALASSNIIMTDELLVKLKYDPYILSIFFHEVGHLHHRHVIKKIISSTLNSSLVFFIIGDLPGLTESLVSLGASLVNLSYSREYENQADIYALKKLHEYGISRKCFADSLLVLSKIKQDQLDSSIDLSTYISSHPSIHERVLNIQKNYKDDAECIIKD